MKKAVFVTVILLTLSLALHAADDDYTKITFSKGLSGNQRQAAFALNEKDKSFVVVFTNYPGVFTKGGIYATYVKIRKNGKVRVGVPRLISDKNNLNTESSIAYNLKTNSYLVAWSSKLPNKESHVVARKLNAKGKPIGAMMKIAQEPGAMNTSPRLIQNYSDKKTGAFVLFWDKAWPEGVVGTQGLFSLFLNDRGGRAGKEELGFASATDPKGGGSCAMKISNITHLGNGNLFMAVNKPYVNYYYGPNDKKTDIFVLMVDANGKFGKPVRVLTGVDEQTGRGIAYDSKTFMLVWNVDRTQIVVDPFSRCFTTGPKLKGPVNNLSFKKEAYESCSVPTSEGAILINNGTWQLNFYQLNNKGRVKKELGKVEFSERVFSEFTAFSLEQDNKVLVVADQPAEGWDTHLYGFIMQAPDGK